MLNPEATTCVAMETAAAGLELLTLPQPATQRTQPSTRPIADDMTQRPFT